jgi:CHAD domain-containing protein
MARTPDTVVVPWTLSTDDRGQPAARVFALVLEAHLEEFRRREQLVRGGEDAEDLHKYRVVIRRTRSLLAAGRGVYPAEELDLLSAMVAQLATLTSPVRDLDVLLEDLDPRTEAVAERLRAGLPTLRAELATARARSRAELTEALEGDFSVVLQRRWQTMASVFRLGGTESGPDALRPAGEVVDDVIWASFRTLRKHGRRAAASEIDDDWHRLRKRLKRFRYLLVAFEDLYPDGTFTRVLRELAGLQEGLGELQDHVARADLIESAGLEAGGGAALLAGALVDHLSAQTPGARRACEVAWSRFDRPKVRRHLREALGRD